MSAEFVDTNVLVYAHDGGAGEKHRISVELLSRIAEAGDGAVSVQVLSEFYSVATRKLGMNGEETEEIIEDLGSWLVYRPGHSTVVKACRLQRRYKVAWWDALVLQSAIEAGCGVLWSEDLRDGQRFGALTVKNPFRPKVRS